MTLTRPNPSMLASPLTPEHFGAKGDGVTDDSAALRAVASALTTGGKLVLAGQYKLDTSGGPMAITTNGVRIAGAGKITAMGALTDDVVNITGSNVVWDGPDVQGDGTYYSTAPAADEDRHALIRVSGTNCHIRTGTLTDPWMCGIRAEAAHNIKISSGVTIKGGPTALVGVYAQGIRLNNVDGFDVFGVRIEANGSGKIEQGIFASDGSRGRVMSNNILAAWDHGIYCINNDGLEVAGNHTLTDKAGIAVSPPEFQSNEATPTHVHHNRVLASATRSGTIGFHLRDMHDAVIETNYVEGFPRAYEMTPVQYSSNNNRIRKIVFANNEAREWTQYGLLIAKAGLLVGQIEEIVIDNFISIAATSGLGTAAGEGAHINAAAGGSSQRNWIIKSPVLRGGRYGIYAGALSRSQIIAQDIKETSIAAVYLTGCNDIGIHGGGIENPGTTGVDLVSCSDIVVDSLAIEDTQATPTMLYGIDGNNNLSGSRLENNYIRAATIPIRRAQFAGHSNSFRGNKTGAASLQGVITLAAGTSTTIGNDNANTASGYTSRVVLTPLNSGAAGIVPYVSTMSAGASFTLGHATAAGSEQYFYEIVQ